MYCFITTVPVAFYWHCSDDTVRYKYNETVNFCGFRCATTSLITVFYELKWNSGRFCACAAKNWLKIPEIVVSFQNFLPYRKSGMENSNLVSNFKLEVVIAVLAHA